MEQINYTSRLKYVKIWLLGITSKWDFKKDLILVNYFLLMITRRCQEQQFLEKYCDGICEYIPKEKSS